MLLFNIKCACVLLCMDALCHELIKSTAGRVECLVAGRGCVDNPRLTLCFLDLDSSTARPLPPRSLVPAARRRLPASFTKWHVMSHYRFLYMLGK